MSSRVGSSRRGIRLLATFVVAVLVATGATACEPRPVQRDRPVIFVHGWSAGGAGVDCNGQFGSMRTHLRNQGFTGSLVTIAFYDSDRNCDVSLRDWGNISNSTSWKDLSKAFSRYVYETYTKKGQTVDVVGHSMGGLIVRGAVHGTQLREAGFAPTIKVEDGVTLGAPHDGAAWYSNFCLWGQCSGLKPGSSELRWLNTNGNPQGEGGTEWTVFGSNSDDVVPAASALSMAVPAERKVRYSSLGHSDFMGNATSQARTSQALAEPGA